MKGLTIADRLGVMSPMLIVEVVLLAASVLVYYVVVHRKAIRSDLTVAKVFLTFWSICQFAAIGAAFAVLIAVISLFQTGQRASLTLRFSAVPFLVMGWIGLVRGAWIYVTLKAPPSDTGAGSAAKPVELDSISGWPLHPVFSYGKHGRNEASNIIVVGILMAAMATFLSLDGAASLLTQILPGLVPQGITARLLRSSADGPIKDGLLLLGFGILTWVGGGALLHGAWKRFLRARPLAVTEHGIYTFYRGKPWKLVRWRDVKTILKIRADTRPIPQVRILIDSADVILLVTPQLSRFPEACKPDIMTCGESYGGSV